MSAPVAELTTDEDVADARSREGNGPFENRFLLVTLACRRVMQIRSGSRIRVDAGQHKPVVVAVAEVRAGRVPYAVSA